MELKNGDTYNGILDSCDSYMNINLKDVICTSKVSWVALLRGRPLCSRHLQSVHPANPRMESGFGSSQKHT